jgi:hypothetical protein
MKLPALLLIMVFSLCGCDIFIEDPGGEGMPCAGPEDCQKGMMCDEHICRKALDESEFDKKCQPDIQGSCKGEFGVCACFPGKDCVCTRPCDNAHDCDNIQIGGSSARCTLIDPITTHGVCADWQWTSSYGNLCIPGDIECDNGVCAAFLGGDLHACTTLCTVGCPADYICGTVPEPAEDVCGIPHWFGFWQACMSSADCDGRFPLFPTCWNDQNCSKFCGSDPDCPPGTYCDNPGSGNCLPDM